MTKDMVEFYAEFMVARTEHADGSPTGPENET